MIKGDHDKGLKLTKISVNHKLAALSLWEGLDKKFYSFCKFVGLRGRQWVLWISDDEGAEIK